MEGVKTQNAIIVAIIITAMSFSSVLAANITVGGSTGWDLSTNLTLWSSSTQIFVNDSLVFKYSIVHDVLEVSKQDFLMCRRTRPIKAYANAEDTVINLTHSGPIYYICGRLNYCALGLKVQINVLDHPDSTPVKQPNFIQPGLQKSDACKDPMIGFLYVILVVTIIWSLYDMLNFFRMMVYLSSSVSLVHGNCSLIDPILDRIKAPTREPEPLQPVGGLRALSYVFTGVTVFVSLWFDMNEANLNYVIFLSCYLLFIKFFEGWFKLQDYFLNQQRHTSTQQPKPGPLKSSAYKDVTIGLLYHIILATIKFSYNNDMPTLHRMLVMLSFSLASVLHFLWLTCLPDHPEIHDLKSISSVVLVFFILYWFDISKATLKTMVRFSICSFCIDLLRKRFKWRN